MADGALDPITVGDSVGLLPFPLDGEVADGGAGCDGLVGCDVLFLPFPFPFPCTVPLPLETLFGCGEDVMVGRVYDGCPEGL